VFGFLSSFLLGECRHRRYTFPMNSRQPSPRVHKGTFGPAYIVCLDCGKRFVYSWERMRIIWTPIENTAEPPARQPERDAPPAKARAWSSAPGQKFTTRLWSLLKAWSPLRWRVSS
jgi:hypothetical protein